MDEKGLRVAVCSGPGDIVALAGKTPIVLAPGQELLLSKHSLSETAAASSDGVGRRAYHSFKLENGLYANVCDISLAGIISKLDSQHSIVNSKNESNRRIVQRLLKTAVVVQQVTNSKGAYRALPVQNIGRDNSKLIPVGFIQSTKVSP